MTKTLNKITRNGHSYYQLMDEKWVNGKPVRKYLAYIGKSPNSKKEIEYGEIMKYVERLLKKDISQEEICQILKKIGIEYDTWPITNIIIENNFRAQKLFLRLK